MHIVLQALKNQDRKGFSSSLAELLRWLQVSSNPMPNIRMVVVTASAMNNAEETLREKAQALRAMMHIDPSLARELEGEEAEHEQVADALGSLGNDTGFILVQP